jgi:hypothetical protein
MRVARALIAAVWNGPFYIGKLERPLSLGDVAMKLLETVWRASVLAVCAVAGIVACIAVVETLPEPKPLHEKVEASIAWGGGYRDRGIGRRF